MDFSDFDLAVEEFFKEFGFQATYIKTAQGVYDTETQEYVTTNTEIPVEAIIMDLTLQSNGLSAKFGTTVMAGDKELYLRPTEKTDSNAAPLVIDPTADRIRVNGIEYKIVTMKEVNPTASNALVYDLYIRR